MVVLVQLGTPYFYKCLSQHCTTRTITNFRSLNVKKNPNKPKPNHGSKDTIQGARACNVR